MNAVLRLCLGGRDPRDPAARRRCGTAAGLVGIAVNLLLSLGKLLTGVLTASVAITADGLNNLSDAATSVVTLAGFRLAAKQADDDHPFGHGRIEYLTGLLVAAAILLVGVELARTSLEKILQPEAVDFSWLSVGILCASILVKLWMSAFNRRLSQRIGSAAMAATAADSLSDVVATSAVLLGTLAGHFFSLRIDGWVGILVAAFILRAGWEAAKDTLDPLLGQSPDPDLVESIQKAVLAHPQVTGVHDLIIHDYGPGRRMMSLHAEVPMDADVLEVHDVIDNIERELKETFHIEAVIHMDPIATKDPQTNALREKMAALVREIDPAMTIHDFRMTVGPDHQNLIFDVVVPHKCPLSDEEVKAAIAGKAGELEGGPFFTVVSIDRSYTDIPAP